MLSTSVLYLAPSGISSSSSSPLSNFTTTCSKHSAFSSTQRTMELEPLTSAAVVFRCRGLQPRESNANIGWEALPHIAALVSAFLEGTRSKHRTIAIVCKRGFGLRILKRFAVQEANEMVSGSKPTMDPFHRASLASKAIIAATRKADDVDVVRWICSEYCPSVVPVEAMGAAAQFGRLGVMQWLCARYPSMKPNRFVADKALEGGQLEMLQWIVSQFNISLNDDDCHLQTAAAMYGHLKIVEWFYECECELQETGQSEKRWGLVALEAALEYNHLEIARFLVDRGYRIDSLGYRFVNQACARSNNLKTIMWLSAQEFAKDNFNWMREAAAAGNLHIVQWIHENLAWERCGVSAIDRAASEGHLAVVQWLHANRTEGCTVKAMDGAASGGHLAVVQWLHANRTEGCTYDAMDGAAEHGHLETVRWLHDHRREGCTSLAMDGAASNGHLKVVQWLHANTTEGCTTMAMDEAATGGHLETVKWLHQNRSEGCTTIAMDEAAKYGHLDVVKWLHENRTEGCTTDAMDNAKTLRVLKWLQEHRWEGCTSEAASEAASEADIERLVFLKEMDLDGFTDVVGEDAIAFNKFETVQWLRANYPDDPMASEDALKEYVTNWDIWTMFLQFESGQQLG